MDLVDEMHHAALHKYLDRYRDRQINGVDEEHHQLLIGFLKLYLLSTKDSDWAAEQVEIDTEEAWVFLESDEVKTEILPQLGELLALKLVWCNMQRKKPMLLLYTHSDVTILGRVFRIPGLAESGILKYLPKCIRECSKSDERICPDPNPDCMEKWNKCVNEMSAKNSNMKSGSLAMQSDIGADMIVHAVYNYGRETEPTAQEVEQHEQNLKTNNTDDAYIQMWTTLCVNHGAEVYMHGRRAEIRAVQLAAKMKKDNPELSYCQDNAIVLAIALSSAFNKENHFELHHALRKHYQLDQLTICKMVKKCYYNGFFFNPKDPEMVRLFSEYPLKFFIFGMFLSINKEQADLMLNNKTEYPWLCDLAGVNLYENDRRLLKSFKRGSVAPTYNEEELIKNAFAKELEANGQESGSDSEVEMGVYECNQKESPQKSCSNDAQNE